MYVCAFLKFLVKYLLKYMQYTNFTLNMIFLKKEDQHQCQAITVTLRNGPLDLHPKIQGTYQLLPVTVNGHECWTSSTSAIWYSTLHKRWTIGPFNDIGSSAEIKGTTKQDQKKLMPCEENCWMYFNKRFNEWRQPDGYGRFYTANDINVQCRGKV